MLNETIYTRSTLINKGPLYILPRRFRPLFHTDRIVPGNNRVRFCVKSIRLNSLLAKFTRTHKRHRFQWETTFIGIEKD